MTRNEICYRCKWLCDGSDSIDDMIRCYQASIQSLRRLKEEGYELREPMAEDYGFLVKTTKKKTTKRNKEEEEELPAAGEASKGAGSSKAAGSSKKKAKK